MHDSAIKIIYILESVSEYFYAASWLIDIEHIIWNSIISSDKLDSDLLTDEQFDELRKLAADCKGWVRTSEFNSSRIFVPIDEWIDLHKKYTGKEMTEDQCNRVLFFMSAPERAKKELLEKSNKLLENMSNVALAIQASGQIEAHKDFIEILKLIPVEFRCCPNCECNPGQLHKSGCRSEICFVCYNQKSDCICKKEI